VTADLVARGVVHPGGIDVGGKDLARRPHLLSQPGRKGGPPAPTSQTRQPGPSPSAARWRNVDGLNSSERASKRWPASACWLSSR
jgi:hypothetical protein